MKKLRRKWPQTPPERVVVAGVDPSHGSDGSSTGTGVVILGKDFELVADWTLRFYQQRYDDTDQRLQTMVNNFIDFGVTHVYMESPVVMRHSRSVLDLGELHGLMRSRLSLADFPIGIVSPTTVKMFALGRGKGGKELILKAVFKRWGYDTNDNNLSDAYSIARLGMDVETGKANQDLRSKIARLPYLESS